MEAMYESLLEVIAVAEYSAEVGAVLISLVLCYSAVDTVSWLAAASDTQPVAKRFQNWVDQFLLPESKRLKCTAEELYAARCGIVHTLSSEAHLHRSKSLRRISYAWGNADVQKLQKRIVESGLEDKLVAVHLSDLTEGLRLGTARFFQVVRSDEALQVRIVEKSKAFYSSLASDAISDLKEN